MMEKVEIKLAMSEGTLKLKLIALDLLTPEGEPYSDEVKILKWNLFLLKRIRRKKAKMIKRLAKMRLAYLEHNK